MSSNLSNDASGDGPSTVPNPGKSVSPSGRKPRARFAPEYEILLRMLIGARRAAGVTQGEMAIALGKTQSHISMCENRERELSIMDLWKWCIAVGINLSEFTSELEKEAVPSIGTTSQRKDQD